jgi:hypothetical protein
MRNGSIPKDAPRNHWAGDLLEKIFHELRNETPNDIFSRELQIGSTSAIQWWHRTVRFARSIAVISVLGHIIGLGDRHLDNILWDLETCDVIHIDFNVCFEKGNRLRIPETVPFRLTQNIVKCLGPTGVEGHFRVACEHTLRVLQQNTDSALTVLDGLLYNPIREWSPEEKVTSIKPQMCKVNARLKDAKPRMQEYLKQVQDCVRELKGAVSQNGQGIHEQLPLETRIERMELESTNEKREEAFERLENLHLVIQSEFSPIASLIPTILRPTDTNIDRGAQTKLAAVLQYWKDFDSCVDLVLTSKPVEYTKESERQEMVHLLT